MKAKRIYFSLLVIVFIVGFGGGGYIGGRFFPIERPFNREEAQTHARKTFIEKLHLDEQQTQVVDSLVNAFRPQFDAVRKAHRQAIGVVRDSMKVEIRKVLSAEQNKIYDEFIKEMETRNREGRREH